MIGIGKIFGSILVVEMFVQGVYAGYCTPLVAFLEGITSVVDSVGDCGAEPTLFLAAGEPDTCPPPDHVLCGRRGSSTFVPARYRGVPQLRGARRALLLRTRFDVCRLVAYA